MFWLDKQTVHREAVLTFLFFKSRTDLDPTGSGLDYDQSI